MSKKNIYLLGIVLTLVLGAFLYQNFCCNCCAKPPKLEETTSVIGSHADLNFFAIQGARFNYHSNDNIKFVKNEKQAVLPFSDSIVMGFEKLKEELQANPNTKIKISGFATSDETNTSDYPNLAIARANAMKNYLVSKGFDSNTFELEGIVKEKWQMISDTLIGPVSFNIIQNPEAKITTDDWALLKNKINEDPLTLYFNTNQATEELTAEESSRIADIVNYVKHVPNAIIRVVGHSDAVGTRDLNIKLGQSRAEFVKRYLIQKGFNSNQIEISSEGPDTPIADNASAAGRAKNRRTVITIK
jgi:outer membrane protein OmpA-like peptidoglycan-associated protein